MPTRAWIALPMHHAIGIFDDDNFILFQHRQQHAFQFTLPKFA
jgi:hypothetical protein